MNDTEAFFFIDEIQGQLFETMKKSDSTFSWDVKCQIVVDIISSLWIIK